MVKKLFPLLFGAIIALTLFVSTGNTAKAADFAIQEESNLQVNHPCTCLD